MNKRMGAVMNSNFTDTSKRHIFIVGCKGIPTRYGGFETFVDTHSNIFNEYLS